MVPPPSHQRSASMSDVLAMTAQTPQRPFRPEDWTIEAMESLIGRVVQKQLADFREPSRAPGVGTTAAQGNPARPCPSYVTSYRCGSKGHYANECSNDA